MENNVRPNFVTDTTTVTPTSTAIRQETGAVWEKVSKKSNTKFLSLRLKFTKNKLQELLNSVTEDEVSLDLVAFPNKKQNGDVRRPSFRIFESLSQGDSNESS